MKSTIQKSTAITSLLALGLTLGLSTLSLAKPNDSTRWDKNDNSDRGDYCIKKITLTDAQKNDMKAMRDQIKKSMSEKRNNTELREQMTALMNEPTFNEEKAKAIIKERSAMREEMELEGLNMRYKMSQILTPEQRNQLSECQLQKRDDRGDSKQKSRKEKRNDKMKE